MKFARITHSLVFRLLALGLVTTVLGTTYSYFRIASFLREDLEQAVAAQQLNLAQYVARDVDAGITERGGYLVRLAAALPRELLGRPQGLKDWLREHQTLQPLFSLGLVVADPQGRVLATFPDAPGTLDKLPVTPAQWDQALVQDLVIAKPRLGPLRGLPILPMSARVLDAAGRPAAVLVGVAEISQEGFLQRLLQSRSGVTGSLLLISPADGVFVAATDASMALRPTPAPGVNRLHDKAMTGWRGSGLTVNALGVEEIAAIVSVPSTGWFVVARLPTAEAFAGVARVQAFIVSQRLVGVLFVLSLIGLIVVLMLRPLYRAAEQADRMTLGEVPLAPLPVGRDDEVGHLTTAFNRLIVKLSENQVELQRLAHHDALTGLPNRQLLADRLEQALARAGRHSTHLALLFMDLDGFKLINDEFGHDAGDEALKQIAERLSGVLRRSDTLARIGGDEFVLLAPDFVGDPRPQVQALAQKCIDVVGRVLTLRGTEQRVGVSIGIALSTGADTVESLLLAADKAMYRAKESGASCSFSGDGG